jgi:hypothetical protein
VKVDAERELERLLGEYFDPTTTNPPALGVRADHTLPPMGADAAKAAAPVVLATAPHPATVTLDSTQDLRENSAQDLLAQFFPDAPSHAAHADPDETREVPAVGALPPAARRTPPRVAPLPTRPPVSEDTAEVSPEASRALLARFRDDEPTPDSTPALTAPAPPPESESTRVTADPRADALLRRYLDDAPEEADPLGLERARSKAALAPAPEDPTEALLRAYLTEGDA